MEGKSHIRITKFSKDNKVLFDMILGNENAMQGLFTSQKETFQPISEDEDSSDLFRESDMSFEDEYQTVVL